MEASVRYVSIKNWQNKPALVIEDGAKFHCVINDHLRVRALRLSRQQFASSDLVMRSGRVYTPLEFLEQIITISKHRPATKAARDLLAGVSPVRAKALVIETAKEGRGVRTRGQLIVQLSEEYKLEPRRIRKILRKAGVHAPYVDGPPVHKALQAYRDAHP